MATQNKRRSACARIFTFFTPEENKKFKAETFSKFSNGKPNKPKYQQPTFLC